MTSNVLVYENNYCQAFSKGIVDLLGNNKNITYLQVNLFDPEEIIYLFSNVNFVISAPLHGCIFSYLAKKNFIGIIYNNKVRTFCNLIKNNNYVAVSRLEDIYSFIKQMKVKKSHKSFYNNYLISSSTKSLLQLQRFINNGQY